MHLPISTNLIKRLITGLVLGLGFWAVYFYLPAIFFSCVLIGILTAIIIFELPQFFTTNRSFIWFLMPLYPVVPFILLIILNHNPLYRELLLILFIVVFSFDTGGYVLGSLAGKHLIRPTISPKKSWEGVVGGYIFANIGMILISIERGYSINWLFIPPFILIVCTLSLTGDLFESWLKRQAAIKDSGTLLPGHGGFLDRFDGIMFAVFFFYLFKDFLVTLFTR